MSTAAELVVEAERLEALASRFEYGLAYQRPADDSPAELRRRARNLRERARKETR